MILVISIYTICEGSDEPAQMRSLARAFADRTLNVGALVKGHARLEFTTLTPLCSCICMIK